MSQILYEPSILNITLHYTEFYKKMKRAMMMAREEKQNILKKLIFC